ncbi:MULTISPECIES: DUF11 domain-containing protein [unclassified Lysobacter]|uniref:beta strand repeat-containing protein n=1 Tax=unclassified Lysobacter TaxID=2635362 RepID=UPI001BE5D2AE|nr:MULTISPECIES: DUF11 domain-containing protein [unclassified Lysobacter]MBT2745264.1 DUF11 domain-containing protein [Lysobacter sp. ISL-42]MBT2751861.1 DUF11 domain-containing protein [Lysobacter sp. ISL-50]MBT2777826.1 DUF11 domain-containing protein [Lysobacter sp. ISL-54]MBT2783082.1 DUF11 domain-containing protein [Lysobacter sp. ISL-52]
MRGSIWIFGQNRVGSAAPRSQLRGLSLLAALAVLLPQSALAAPWTCDSAGYLFQRSASGVNSVTSVDLATGVATPVGNMPISVNGVGYNTLDNYFYGAVTSGGGGIVRINSDLTTTVVSTQAGSNMGDFDDAGHYWSSTGGGNNPTAWKEIDFSNPASATYGTVIRQGTFAYTAGTFMGDWSWINGSFYFAMTSFANPTATPRLGRFTPGASGNGTFTDLGPIAGIPNGAVSTAGFGASYTDSNDYLYIGDNGNGKIFRVDVTGPGTPSGILAATGPVSSQNDGARCADAGVPTVTVIKSVAGRAAAADQFTVSLVNTANTTLTSATTTGAATSATTADWPVSQNATYTIRDAMAAGSTNTLAAYAATIACTDTDTGAAVAVTGTAPNWSLAIATDHDYSCTVTNTPGAPLQLAKAWGANSTTGNQVTIGATTGGANNTVAFNATAPTAANSGTPVTVGVGNAITLPAETGAALANYTTTVACTGGHTLSGTNGQQTNTLTITSRNAAVCTYTNTPRTATLTLRKQWSGAAVGDDATITVSRGATVLDTLNSDAGAAGELDADATPTTVLIAETVTLAETLAAANVGLYDTTLACTGSADTDPADGLIIGAADTAIVCTYTNTHRIADLSITKTNTPAAGALDQASDTVNSGQTTTYTMVVTNDGTTAVTGAIVRDTPGAGITCPPGNAVTIAGDGVPAGSFTVADLSGANGIVLGALAAGQSTTLSFTCQVN